ncbi:MAG TPA: glycerophosphodiester phosphodiesterase [Verrucomicrobiae bacterium]|jgi:glycerophosphoryl diester phosphodiesterase|nr:glycerophosphodiester phosphodiesterase [Verrucomicrobiae bacterium]
MKIVGHRGARGLAPENTIASLQKALEHHVDELEFDLRVTKDNVVILNHSSLLADASGARLTIRNYGYAELKAHKPDLATFEEVLETIGHSVPLYVEVKRGEPTGPIIKILKKYLANGWQPGHFLLGSKIQKTLLQLHTALPEIPTIVIEPWSGVRAHYRARQLDTKLVSVNQHWLWWGFIRGFKNNGWQLYAYTLNNPAKARRWARYGLTGVVTDYPDRFEKQ